jgi:nucleoside-diphosphate-sugar epimerase
VPGAGEEDYRRINYDGAVNVFEAARDAGVPRFIFASSAQVYRINSPVRIDQFPILESNYLPTLAEGQSVYGLLKAEFERYLARACVTGGTQAVALRLECPGVRSNTAGNFYVSTSIENTVAAFASALEAELSTGFEACNVADGHIDPGIVDVQAFLQTHWPTVPNHTHGNEGLLSIDQARRLLGYAPIRGRTYYPLSLIWG